MKKRVERTYSSFSSIPRCIFPDKNNMIGVLNKTSLEEYLGMSAIINGEVLCIEDILVTQYYLAFYSDYQDSLGTTNKKSKYEILVGEMNIREILNYRTLIMDCHSKEYSEIYRKLEHPLLKDIEKNLWRNNAISQFATILRSNCKRVSSKIRALKRV